MLKTLHNLNGETDYCGLETKENKVARKTFFVRNLLNGKPLWKRRLPSERRSIHFKYTFLCLFKILKIHAKLRYNSRLLRIPLYRVCQLWTSLTWLNLFMVVRFSAWANFQYCPSCVKKWCMLHKWSKVTWKLPSCSISLIQWHTLCNEQTTTFGWVSDETLLRKLNCYNVSWI